MTLIETVQQLDSLNHEQTIYAQKPWTPASVVKLITDSDKMTEDGLDYFLEVFIAKDFIDDWRASLSRSPSPDDSCNRLIRYAIDGA